MRGAAPTLALALAALLLLLLLAPGFVDAAKRKGARKTREKERDDSRWPPLGGPASDGGEEGASPASAAAATATACPAPEGADYQALCRRAADLFYAIERAPLRDPNEGSAFAAAVACLRRAVKAQAQDGRAWMVLGDLQLLRARRARQAEPEVDVSLVEQAAVRNYQQALKQANELHPDSLFQKEACRKLADAHARLGALDRAIALLEKCTEQAPDPADLNELGLLYSKRGEHMEAVRTIERAIELAPTHAALYNNLGTVMTSSPYHNRLQTAEVFAKAVQLSPETALFHQNLAQTYLANDNAAGALQHFLETIRLDPNSHEATLAAARLQLQLGRPRDASKLFARALELTVRVDPRSHHADLYEEVADSHLDAGNYSGAADLVLSFESATAPLLASLPPDSPQARDLVARRSRMFFYRLHVLVYSCDWRDWAESQRRARAIIEAEAADEYHRQHFMCSLTPSRSLSTFPHGVTHKVIELHCHHMLLKLPAEVPAPPWYLNKAAEPNELVHIGYVSHDWGLHHPMNVLVNGFVRAHDRSRFRVFCYFLGEAKNVTFSQPLFRSVASECDVFRNLAWTKIYEPPADTAQRLLADRLDVIVDLTGFTATARPARVMAAVHRAFSGSEELRRAGPVVLNYLGWPAPTCAFYHYNLVDRVASPPAFEARGDYSEKLVYLPSLMASDHRHVYSHGASSWLSRSAPFPTRAARVAGRATQGFKPGDYVLFCSFNQLFKTNPAQLEALASILARAPHVQLALMALPEEAVGRVRSELDRLGVAAGRVQWFTFLEKPQFFARVNKCDLYLDTFHYGSGGTAVDVTWAGTPLLTLPGDRIVNRMAASLNVQLGHEELITQSPAEFVERAVALANDLERLERIRAALWTQRWRRGHSVFDPAAWVAALEQAVERARRQHAAGADETFEQPAVTPTPQHYARLREEDGTAASPPTPAPAVGEGQSRGKDDL
jgi:predicted O-linked N-acetylglucosamine transferase (SPINDLY family)